MNPTPFHWFHTLPDSLLTGMPKSVDRVQLHNSSIPLSNLHYGLAKCRYRMGCLPRLANPCRGHPHCSCLPACLPACIHLHRSIVRLCSPPVDLLARGACCWCQHAPMGLAPYKRVPGTERCSSGEAVLGTGMCTRATGSMRRAAYRCPRPFLASQACYIARPAIYGGHLLACGSKSGSAVVHRRGTWQVVLVNVSL